MTSKFTWGNNIHIWFPPPIYRHVAKKQKPWITMQFQVERGKTLLLECEVRRLGQYVVLWRKGWEIYISETVRKFLVCFVSSILHYHSHDPDSVRVGSQNKDISYFWENSDLTEIIYLPPEMAPYSWTHQSWNNKFSRFAKVGIIFIWGSVIQKWDG